MSTIPEQILTDADGAEFYYPPRLEVLSSDEARLLSIPPRMVRKLEDDERISYRIASLKAIINEILNEAAAIRATLPADPMIVYWDYTGTKFTNPHFQAAFDGLFKHRPGPKPGEVVLHDADYGAIYEPYYAAMVEYREHNDSLMLHQRRLEQVLQRKAGKTRKIKPDGSMV